jgi:hypothetical protein
VVSRHPAPGLAAALGRLARVAGVALALAGIAAPGAKAGQADLLSSGGLTGTGLRVQDLTDAGGWQGSADTSGSFFDTLLSEQNRYQGSTLGTFVHTEQVRYLLLRDDEQPAHYDTPTSTVPIELSSLGAAQVIVTNSNDQPVPEPAALALFSVGLAALGCVQLRKAG